MSANQLINVLDVGTKNAAYAVLLGQLLRNGDGHCIAIESYQNSFKILNEIFRMNVLTYAASSIYYIELTVLIR